jgi:enolase-phosphatase E1
VTARVVLLDIEGTVWPLAYVKDAMFPFARARLVAWVHAHADDPVVREVSSDAATAVQTLLAWSDADQKVTALKTIQGRIWKEGFASGALVTPLYDDVVPALDAWRAAGARVAISSSGSVEAQRLLFAHCASGDATLKLSAYFDTTTRPKRVAASYLAIARALEVEPAQVSLCSDIDEEVSAARTAGLEACLIVRDAPPIAGARATLPTP